MFRNANGISTHTGVMKRTYDIGESCAYGTAKVHYEDNARIVVRLCKYKTNEAMESAIFDFVDKFKLQMYLEDNMPSYYADKIMEDFYVK